MKDLLRKTISILFALLCLGTAALSNSILGPGMWFWIIIVAGIFVGISQFFPGFQSAGSLMAGLLSVVSVCAVLLGLLAATVGGSFRLDDNEAFLFMLFALVAASGFALVALCRKTQSDS